MNAHFIAKRRVQKTSESHAHFISSIKPADCHTVPTVLTFYVYIYYAACTLVRARKLCVVCCYSYVIQSYSKLVFLCDFAFVFFD